MRKDKKVRDEVLSFPVRYRVVRPARSRAKNSAPSKIKDLVIDGRRYVVCLNEEQARKDVHDRQQIVVKLETKLREGAKSLVEQGLSEVPQERRIAIRDR